MINEAISKSPVVLLLGAGASAPLGKPLMGGFVRRLQNMRPYGASPLFNAIVQQQPDLEFLFEELEDWKRKEYYAPQAGSEERTGGVLGLESPKPSDRWYVGQLVDSAGSLLRSVKREVFNTYRDIGPSERVVQLLEPLIGTVAELVGPRDNPIVTFTTNYDSAVEVFCQQGEYDLFDGFVAQPSGAGYVWRREAIDHFDPSSHPGPCIVLFKLHGSTDWFRKGNNFVKSPVSAFLESDPNYENLLIYPAQRKIATEDPYSTAYEYFQRTLERAQLCVVVGYSFRDYDALSRMRLASSYNPILRTIVLDPNAEMICRDLNRGGVQAIPVPKNLGHPEDAYIPQIREALERLPYR